MKKILIKTLAALLGITCFAFGGQFCLAYPPEEGTKDVDYSFCGCWELPPDFVWQAGYDPNRVFGKLSYEENIYNHTFIKSLYWQLCSFKEEEDDKDPSTNLTMNEMYLKILLDSGFTKANKDYIQELVPQEFYEKVVKRETCFACCIPVKQNYVDEDEESITSMLSFFTIEETTQGNIVWKIYVFVSNVCLENIGEEKTIYNVEKFLCWLTGEI